VVAHSNCLQLLINVDSNAHVSVRLSRPLLVSKQRKCALGAMMGHGALWAHGAPWALRGPWVPCPFPLVWGLAKPQHPSPSWGGFVPSDPPMAGLGPRLSRWNLPRRQIPPPCFLPPCFPGVLFRTLRHDDGTGG